MSLGVNTVIHPVPLVSIIAAETVAVSFVDDTYVVANCDVPQSTVDAGMKFAPVTVSVNEFPPGATDTGLIACTNGTGTPPAPAIALGARAAAIIKSISPAIAIFLPFPCRRACKRILISWDEALVFRSATNDPVRFGAELGAISLPRSGAANTAVAVVRRLSILKTELAMLK